MTEEAPRRRGGRPKHVPTEQQRKLARDAGGLGIPLKLVARLVGVDIRTLHKHYDEDIEPGRAAAGYNVVRKGLYDVATKGRNELARVRAAERLTKTWFGAEWGDKVIHAHEGTDGPPMKTETNGAMTVITKEMTAKEAAEAYAATLSGADGS